MQETLNYFKGDDLAANVWLSKYAAPGETTPDQMHARLAKEFARIDAKYQETEFEHKSHLSDYGQSRADLTEERILNYFKNFKYIVPQGSVMSTLGTQTIASLSNCYVVEEPGDSYGYILKTDEELAHLYKRRGGVGTGVSKLRPAGAPTTNTGKSSTGPISFMERFSNTTREVAMNGRRGALMLTIDIRHPDVEQFIEVKKDRTKVTGANISIKVRDDFMQAVKTNSEYCLRFPCDIEPVKKMSMSLNMMYQIDGNYYKWINARDLWDKIIKGAWDSAEPGLLFIDRAIDYSPDGVYDTYRPTNTNP